MKKVTQRDFKVEFFEKENEVWVVETHLNDEPHEIHLTLEIDMLAMQIMDARIQFLRYPVEHCPLIEKKASCLIGLKIDHEFSRNVMKLFLGPQGCPNIMTLVNLSVPGIIYYYYPYKLKTGQIQPETWDQMVRTELKNDCLAHTLL
jgi:hypothetical protein